MATNYSLNITQGSRFHVRLQAKDSSANIINLSGYGARGHVKHRYSDTGILLDLNPTGVRGEYQNGYIDIFLSGAQTAQLPICQGVYDVEIYATGASWNPNSGVYVDKIAKGLVNIFPEVTTHGGTLDQN